MLLEYAPLSLVNNNSSLVKTMARHRTRGEVVFWTNGGLDFSRIYVPLDLYEWNQSICSLAVNICSIVLRNLVRQNGHIWHNSTIKMTTQLSGV